MPDDNVKTERVGFPDGHVDGEGEDENDGAKGGGRALTRVGRVYQLAKADGRRNAQKIIPDLEIVAFVKGIEVVIGNKTDSFLCWMSYVDYAMLTKILSPIAVAKEAMQP